MLYFLAKAERNNVMVSYNTPLAGLCKDRGGWICKIQEENGEKTTIFSRTVINSAGLFSAHVASMAGIDYKLHY
jgi:L-2-hydroxyglutarate oxidase LhgO